MVVIETHRAVRVEILAEHKHLSTPDSFVQPSGGPYNTSLGWNFSDLMDYLLSMSRVLSLLNSV